MFNPAAEYLGSHSKDIFQGVSLGVVLLGLGWVIVKYEFIQLVSVEEGTVALRLSWGKPRRFHFGRRKGRMIVLVAGRHLVIRGIHGLAIISLRQEILKLEARDLTFEGRTLRWEGTLTWRVTYEDSPEGDRHLYNRVWSVADKNVQDQAIGKYEARLVALFEQGLRTSLHTTGATEEGFPDIQLANIQRFVRQPLLEQHGAVFTELSVQAMAWTGEQINRDGRVEAAKLLAEALRHDPSSNLRLSAVAGVIGAH